MKMGVRTKNLTGQSEGGISWELWARFLGLDGQTSVGEDGYGWEKRHSRPWPVTTGQVLAVALFLLFSQPSVAWGLRCRHRVHTAMGGSHSVCL